MNELQHFTELISSIPELRKNYVQAILSFVNNNPGQLQKSEFEDLLLLHSFLEEIQKKRDPDL